VYVDGAKFGATPIALELDNKTGVTIAVKTKDGKQGACLLASSAGVGWILLDLLFGLVPLVIDAMTSGWSSLDKDRCHINPV
jgi:hypothetical protein